RAPKESAEMFLQRAGRHAAGGGETGNGPRALRLGLESGKRPGQVAWKRLRGHGAAPHTSYTAIGAHFGSCGRKTDCRQNTKWRECGEMTLRRRAPIAFRNRASRRSKEDIMSGVLRKAVLALVAICPAAPAAANVITDWDAAAV